MKSKTVEYLIYTILILVAFLAVAMFYAISLNLLPIMLTRIILILMAAIFILIFILALMFLSSKYDCLPIMNHEGKNNAR